MQKREDQPDYLSAVFIFMGVGLLWLFMLLWALFGFAAVLVLAVFLNHVITRIDVVLNDRQGNNNGA